VLYGQKPYTELFSLSWDWSSGFPKADLRPIVWAGIPPRNRRFPPDPRVSN